ncbi:MAG: DNA-binding protein [Candidatus Sedimenticola sp. (ex Thyasira tokunagai)]
MGRPANITKEQVFSAADQLVSEGKKPTIRAIREMLGTGNNNTIMQHVDDWKQSKTPSWTPSIPKEIETLGSSLVNELWVAANKHFDQQLTAIRAAFEAEKNDLKGELTDSFDIQDGLETSIEHLSSENTRLESDSQIVGTKCISLQAQLDSANDTIEKLRSDVDRHLSNERLAAERAIHAELLLEGMKSDAKQSDSTPEANQNLRE